MLGIGAAWFEREHEAFGIDFGTSPGVRLDWLDEAVMLLRRLLDGERVTHDGPRYALRDALCEPRPVQAHLPILIGGSGRRKTLRTVALQGRCLEHLRRARGRSGGTGSARGPRGRRRARSQHAGADDQLPDRHPRRRRRRPGRGWAS